MKGPCAANLGRADAACAVLWGSIAGTWIVLLWRGDLGTATLVASGAGMLLGGLVARWPIRRLGPLNLLRPVALVWSLVVGVFVVDALLDLAPGALVAAGGVAGVVTGWVAVTWLVLRRHAADPVSVGACVVGAALGLSVAAIVLLLTGVALALTVTALGGLAAAALLRGLRDPLRPDDPLRRFAAWGDGSGRRARSGWRRMFAAPATSLYLVVSWALFLPVATVRRGILHAPEEWGARWGYEIPVLTEDPLAVPRILLTAPLVNHDIVQLVYVSLILLLFGVPFEVREGTGRFLLLFVGVGAAAALLAGIILHVVYPDISTHPALSQAWTATWTGGSAGAFAILGGSAARAPHPWPLLAAFVIWELNVGWWFLQSYTPAFHLTALAAAFAWTRWGLAPRLDQRG